MSIVILLSMSKFVYFTFCSVLKLSRYQENICEKKLRNCSAALAIDKSICCHKNKAQSILTFRKTKKMYMFAC